jgi:hypothetical protein
MKHVPFLELQPGMVLRFLPEALGRNYWMYDGTQKYATCKPYKGELVVVMPQTRSCGGARMCIINSYCIPVRVDYYSDEWELAEE